MDGKEIYYSDLPGYLETIPDAESLDVEKTEEMIKRLTLRNTNLLTAKIPSIDGRITLHVASKASVYEFNLAGVEDGREVPKYHSKFFRKFEVPVDADLQIDGRNKYKWFACVYFFSKRVIEP